MIVKQSDGIDYNSMLNKFSSSYSNSNSARAALSRSLKDLTTFGYLARKGNRYYLMEKGELEIYSEIKNKLVLALNSTMAQKEPYTQADEIAVKLQVVIERSRQDKSLLKTCKSSLNFNIADLEQVEADLKKNIKHREYISKILSDQVSALKELDFNDCIAVLSDSNSLRLIEKIFFSVQEPELVAECHSKELLAELAGLCAAKLRENSFSFPKEMLRNLISFFLQKSPGTNAPALTIFSSMLKAQFRNGRVFITGPYSELSKWKTASGN